MGKVTKDYQKTSEGANEYEAEQDVEEKLAVRPARVMTWRGPSLHRERSDQDVKLPLRAFEISSEFGTSSLNIGGWRIHSKGFYSQFVIAFWSILESYSRNW